LIVDTSAMIAILFEEPDWETLRDAIKNAPSVRMTAPTLVELRTVVASRRNTTLTNGLAVLLSRFDVEIVAFDRELAELALAGYRQYGKGFHSRARLNLGDCFSYALAKATGEPLLFIGDDFSYTDIIPALAP